MFEIFTCDDDVKITDFIKFFIEKNWGESFNVFTMNSCGNLLRKIEIDEHVPDILIMDINLGDGNGIDTVKRIQAKHPKLKVIYLTGVINYATAIFETNPSYFLLKPINEGDLLEAINKVSKEIENDKADSFVIKTNGSEMVLFRKDVVYVESRGRKLIFIMADGKRFEFYEKMDDVQKILGASFVRSHKSFLINMKFITGRTNNEFFLSNGMVLPISKSNLKEAKIRFIDYLGGDQ